MTQKRIIRIELNDDNFRKYKVFCAISDLSMTKQTNKLIEEFIKLSEKEVRITRINPIEDASKNVDE